MNDWSFLENSFLTVVCSCAESSIITLRHSPDTLFGAVASVVIVSSSNRYQSVVSPVAAIFAVIFAVMSDEYDSSTNM